LKEYTEKKVDMRISCEKLEKAWCKISCW